MRYEPSRRAKILVLLILATLLLLVFSRPYWGSAKEAYFNRTLRMCSNANGVRTQTWVEVGAFDAAVKRYVAHARADRAVIACTSRWAGWMIRPVPAPEEEPQSFCALTVSVRGQNVQPSEYIFDIERNGCGQTFSGTLKYSPRNHEGFGGRSREEPG